MMDVTKGRFNRRATDERLHKLYQEIHDHGDRWGALFRQYAKCFNGIVDEMIEDCYSSYEYDDGWRFCRTIEDVQERMFDEELDALYDVIDDVFPGIDEDAAYQLYCAALEDESIQEALFDGSYDLLDTFDDREDEIADWIDDLSEDSADPGDLHGPWEPYR